MAIGAVSGTPLPASKKRKTLLTISAATLLLTAKPQGHFGA
jgi:hypothetical protein